MLFRLHFLSAVSAALFCGATLPAAAQDFKQLVDKGSQAWEKGNCKDAESAFYQALTLANLAVGLADQAEQLRVQLLEDEALICLGELDRAVRHLGTLPAVQPQVQFLLAEATKAKGQYSEAEQHYGEAAQLARQSLGPTDPRGARYLAGWADLGRLRGQYNESETRLQQAVSSLDSIGARDSIERAYTSLAAGDLAKDRDRWKEARSRYNDALAIAKTKGPEHPVAARAWLGLGLVELAAGETDTAETNLKLAQNASLRLPAAATNFDIQDAFGLCNLSRRKLKEAEANLVSAFENRRSHLGDGHPSTAVSLDHLGLLFIAQQRWDRALDTLGRAEKVRRQVLGPDHPELAQTLYHLGSLYRVQRKFQDAASSLDEALKIQTSKLGNESLAVASTVAEQANLLADQSKYSDAEQKYRQALAIEEKLMVPPGAPAKLAPLRGLALTLHRESKDDEGGPLLVQWMRARGDGLPSLDADRLPVAIALAEIELHAGKYADAEKHFTEILSANDKLGKDALKLPLVQKGLGDAFFGEKKWKDAARTYEAALPGLSDQPNLGRAWENLGASYAAQAQWAESIRAYQRALDIAKKPGAPDANTGRLMLLLADLSWDAGRTDLADAYLKQWMPAHGGRAASLSADEARVLEKSALQFSGAKQYAMAETVLRILLAASDKPGTQGSNLNRILVQLAEACAAQNKNADAAGLYQRLAMRSRAVSRLGDSEQFLLLSKALREKDGGPNAVGLLPTLQELGETYVSEFKYAEARTAFEQTRSILQQNGLSDDPRMALSLNGLGSVFQGERNFDEAAKLYGQAEDVLKKVPDASPRIKATVLCNVGSLKMTNGKGAEAADYFTECLKLSEQNYTAENPPPIEQFDQIAGAYERSQRFEEADQRYRANLELRRKFFGENSAEAAWGLYSLAVFHNARGRYDEAAEEGEHALRIFEGRSGEESDEVALVLGTLATIYKAKSDIEHAIVAADRSEQIQEKLGRPRDEISFTLSALGEYYRSRRDYGKALKVYEKMAKLWESESFANLNYQRAVLQMAIQYAYLTDVVHSLEQFSRLRKALQQQHDPIQNIAKSYADALASAGFDKEARKVLEQAGLNNRGPGRE